MWSLMRDTQPNSTAYTLNTALCCSPDEDSLTCVSAEVSLQVRTLEVCFLAARKVADIIPSARKVSLCGSISCWHKHWGRGKGEELSAAQGHYGLRGLRWLWCSSLRNHKHHGALWDRGTYQQGWSKARSRLGQHWFWTPCCVDLSWSLDKSWDHPCPTVNWENLTKEGSRGRRVWRWHRGAGCRSRRSVQLICSCLRRFWQRRHWGLWGPGGGMIRRRRDR